MTLELLREELTLRGVRLEPNGDRLNYRAPKGAVADLLPDIQRFKPALLELLEWEANLRRWQNWAATHAHTQSIENARLRLSSLEAVLGSEGACRAIAAAAKIHLRGFNLVCSCPLDGPCHGEALLRIANEEEVSA